MTALLSLVALVGSLLTYQNLGSCLKTGDLIPNGKPAWFNSDGSRIPIRVPVGTNSSPSVFSCDIMTDQYIRVNASNQTCGRYIRFTTPGRYYWTIQTLGGTGNKVKIDGAIITNRVTPVGNYTQWVGRSWEAPWNPAYTDSQAVMGGPMAITPRIGPYATAIESSGVDNGMGGCNVGTGASLLSKSSWYQANIYAATQGYIGSPCNQTVNCQVCAWPYASVTAGCGCAVDRTKLQTPVQISGTCKVWAQTADCGGTPYFDPSRSNFNPDVGPIRCAAACPSTGRVVYMPAGTCPESTFVAINLPTDSLGASVDSGGMQDDPMTYGGGSSGSGSDTGTHSRLDSILGILDDGRDSDSIAGLPDSTSWDSVQAASTGVQADIDSLQVGRSRTGGPWSATVPYPDTIEMRMDVPVFGTVMDTSLIVDWEIPGFPFDLWALFRWIEWVFVTMAMIPLFVRIAGGNEDS